MYFRWVANQPLALSDSFMQFTNGLGFLSWLNYPNCFLVNGRLIVWTREHDFW